MILDTQSFFSICQEKHVGRSKKYKSSLDLTKFLLKNVIDNRHLFCCIQLLALFTEIIISHQPIYSVTVACRNYYSFTNICANTLIIPLLKLPYKSHLFVVPNGFWNICLILINIHLEFQGNHIKLLHKVKINAYFFNNFLQCMTMLQPSTKICFISIGFYL